MKPKILHLDFETRSACDLRAAGLHVYARHESTSILCFAWAFNDEPVQAWTPGLKPPSDVIDHVQTGGEVWAHSAEFEREMWNFVLRRQTGIQVPLKTEQMVCTKAMAYAMALPGSLEKCAAALGVDQQKDSVGYRIMLQLSQPKEVELDGTIVWWEDDEKFTKLVAYCAQDVEVERAIGKRMLKLSPFETDVWRLDQRINSRGIAVDVDAVRKTIDLVENEKFRLNAKMRRITGNQIATCNATQQTKDYLAYFGVDADSISKAHVKDYLADETLHAKARMVLELRALGAKAATAKLKPMLARAESGGRLQGMFQYSGAGTRRWAGRSVQLQNLKRPGIKSKEIDEIIAAIKNNTPADELELLYGPPLNFVSDCIRGMLIAAPRHDLLVSDFSSIEARVLAWLAGEEDVLNVFRSKQDIYKVQASQIFRVPVDQATDAQRQVGKVAILALGYQGGVGAFQTMARGYGVKMAPAFDALWSVASAEAREKAQANFKTNGEKFEISEAEFLASDLTKIAWRAANARIVQYWYDAERAMIEALGAAGNVTAFGPKGRQVQFKKSGSFLWCKLPSGGVNCYPYPEIQNIKTPWGDVKPMVTYKAEDGQSKKWQRFTVYGGSIAENITQSVARDLLAVAMLNLDTHRYNIVAHVHDEIVCEVPEKFGSLEEMNRLMTAVPKWAEGLPLAAAGYRAKRYRK